MVPSPAAPNIDRTGAKMFGLMVLDQGMHGASFALGIRNSHDKSFRSFRKSSS